MGEKIKVKLLGGKKKAGKFYPISNKMYLPGDVFEIEKAQFVPYLMEHVADDTPVTPPRSPDRRKRPVTQRAANIPMAPTPEPVTAMDPEANEEPQPTPKTEVKPAEEKKTKRASKKTAKKEGPNDEPLIISGDRSGNDSVSLP